MRELPLMASYPSYLKLKLTKLRTQMRTLGNASSIAESIEQGNNNNIYFGLERELRSEAEYPFSAVLLDNMSADLGRSL